MTVKYRKTFFAHPRRRKFPWFIELNQTENLQADAACKIERGDKASSINDASVELEGFVTLIVLRLRAATRSEHLNTKFC